LELAAAAGTAVLDTRQRGPLSVDFKIGNEPVTEADRLASSCICDGLTTAFPDDTVVSEERPLLEGSLKANRLWLIDPIDGTKDFIEGSDGFAVMIGLLISSIPVLGVVHLAAQHRTYWATPEGAQWRSGESVATLSVSRVTSTRDARLVASRSHRSPKLDHVKRDLGIIDELNIPSIGAKLGLIAAGARDVYIHPASTTKLWDICAPHAILKQAGGNLTDLLGNDIDYASGFVNDRGLVASNGHLHDEVIRRLRPFVAELGVPDEESR
jgi:3'(2'), 5'-bisphosphate nucleotidase